MSVPLACFAAEAPRQIFILWREESMYNAGFDIGGTKCAVLLADADDSQVRFVFREEIPTRGTWKEILDALCSLFKQKCAEYSIPSDALARAGISCGGPLDCEKGIICSPPNLPGWDAVPVCDYLQEKLGVVAALMNDADAGAVAEWRYGAGRGAKNMIFLTFGTGLGAGLILGGKLYCGTNGMAGEIGHVRLEKSGPVGYGKKGSCEGFCSGGGLRQIARRYAEKAFREGKSVSFCENEAVLGNVDAKKVVRCAETGAEDAKQILAECGRNFGRTLAILVDILNPEVIVGGSIFLRAYRFLYPYTMETLRQEAIARSVDACRVVPSQLQEKIGDYAAIVASPLIRK